MRNGNVVSQGAAPAPSRMRDHSYLAPLRVSMICNGLVERPYDASVKHEQWNTVYVSIDRTLHSPFGYDMVAWIPAIPKMQLNE